MYCGYCKTELKGNEKFCPKCGNELPKVDIVPEHESKKRKKSKRIYIIASFLIALIVSCMAGVFFFKKNDNTYLALVKNKNGKYGFMNEKGEEVIGCKFDFASPFMSNGLAVFGEKKYGYDGEYYKYGLIDEKGDILIPATYDEINWKSCSYSNETQYVEVAKQVDIDENGDAILNWGWIDASGQLVVECEYDSFPGRSCWKSGICIAVKEDQYGAIDIDGNEVISIGEYECIGDINDNGLLTVKNGNDKWGVIDINDNVIIPFEYSSSSFGDNGLICVEKQIYDTNGEEKGLYGYINEKGDEVIPFQYEVACGFSNGFAFVRGENNGEKYWGYIDESGEMKKTHAYSDWVYGNTMKKNGNATVYGSDDNGMYLGLFDTEGNEIVPFKYKWGLFEADFMRYSKDEVFNNDEYAKYYVIYNMENEDVKKGLLDAVTGEIVIPVSHDILWKGDNNWFLVGDLDVEGDDGSDLSKNEYSMTYVDEKGNTMLQLPDKYVFASEFVKMPERKNRIASMLETKKSEKTVNSQERSEIDSSYVSSQKSNIYDELDEDEQIKEEWLFLEGSNFHNNLAIVVEQSSLDGSKRVVLMNNSLEKEFVLPKEDEISAEIAFTENTEFCGLICQGLEKGKFASENGDYIWDGNVSLNLAGDVIYDITDKYYGTLIGNGYMLVTEIVSGYQKQTPRKGIIDGYGNEVIPISEEFAELCSDLDFAESGIAYFRGTKTFVDANRGEYYCSGGSIEEYRNGNLLVYGGILLSNDGTQEVRFEDDYDTELVLSDDKVIGITYNEHSSNGVNIKTYDLEGNLLHENNITDIDLDEKNFSFENGISAFYIKGNDGNYVTMIDENGDFLFEPIKCSNHEGSDWWSSRYAMISEGILRLAKSKTETVFIDEKGQEVLSIPYNIDCVGDCKNGKIVVNTGIKCFYVDKSSGEFIDRE